ncbi:MAG TPA: hypothetical protein VFD92_27580 [Candidatus Binatia bacterium]|nr:hypothetical protein [Candidatus Binatia bacterium]
MTARPARVVATALALAAAACVALPARVGAQQLAALFPREADVTTTAPGLARLPLPPDVLEACSPDLADLRLFDRAGAEVPFLVDPGAPIGGERRETRSVPARVVDVARDETVREGLPAATRETYRLALPERGPPGGAWRLVVDASRARYVRSVEVRGIRPAGDDVVLVPRASIVRLGQALVDRSEIPLPPFDGRELVVVIEGEDGSFLEPTFRFESERALASDAAVALPLAIRDRRQAAGRSVFELERPPGLVTTRLRVASATPALDRAVTVWDVAASGEATRIGEARIVRTPAVGDVPAIDHLDVDLARARGERLRVEIADGDSPPLADVSFRASFTQPAIVFALPAAPDGDPAGVLRFGGDRAWRPRYDVADLFRDALAATGRGDLADATALPRAILGPIRANPLFDARPALARAMQPGPAIDRDGWQWHRPVSAPESAEGLVRIRLSADDLAHARADLADLRVIDGGGRQWPYLVGPAGVRERVDLRAAGPKTEDGVSVWTIALPSGPLTLDRLSVVPARSVLHRPFRLVGRDESGGEREIARGVLAQDLRRPEPVEIAFEPTRVESLELGIEDGDDAPTEIERAETSLAARDVLLVAPAGSYTLLAGNPDASAPQYDVARAREVVLGLRSAPAVAGDGAENPRWTGTPGGAARMRARLQQSAVWAVIVVAVLVLAAVTLRMARGESARRS